MIALLLTILLVCLSACGPSGGSEGAPASTAPTAAPATAAPATDAAAPATPPADAAAEATAAAGEPGATEPGAAGQAAPKSELEQSMQGALVPADAPQAASASIPDIDKHRAEELSYVRTSADRVKLDLGPIDLEADPILIVDKRPVSRAEFQRHALMYSGEAEIERHITHMLTEAEVKRATAAGADPTLFEVSEADIDAKFEELKEFVALQAEQQKQSSPPQPGDPDPVELAVENYLASIESSIGMDAYRKLLGADARFERVFLPLPAGKVPGEKIDPAAQPPSASDPKPDWVPQASWDALGGDDQALMLRTFIVNWAIDGEEVPAMFRAQVLARVRDGLVANTGVKFFFDEELPKNVLLRVGSELVETDEIWPLVKAGISDADVELIAREFLMLEGMRAALEASDRWLDEAEFAPQWKAENDKYIGSFIPLKSMIMFRGYSSLDRYREHFRYRQAYNLWRKETLTEADVLAHYQGGGRLFFERGAIVVDLAFKPLGGVPFTAANLEACRKELADAITGARTSDTGDTPAGQTPEWWKAVAQRFPSPPSREGMDAHAMQRSQLRMAITEDELSIFLAGYSLTDDAFYHGHAGDVYGPFVMSCRRHAWGAESNAGAWAIYVRDFSRRQTLTPFEGAQRDLAYEDFLDLNYFHWSSECLAALLPKVKRP
jgi:hypothetical protein